MLSLAVAIVAVMGVLLVPESFVFLFAAGISAFGAARAGVLVFSAIGVLIRRSVRDR